jgi:hypothetical protein
MQIGPVRFRADPRSQLAQRPFDHRLMVGETDFDAPSQASDIAIQELYGLTGGLLLYWRRGRNSNPRYFHIFHILGVACWQEAGIFQSLAPKNSLPA